MSQNSNKEEQHNLLGSLLDDEDEPSKSHTYSALQKRIHASSAPPVLFELGFKISETFLENEDFDSPDPQDISIKQAFTKKQSFEFEKSEHQFHHSSYRKMSCDIELLNYYNTGPPIQQYSYLQYIPLTPEQELLRNLSRISEWAKDQNGSRTVQNIFEGQDDQKKDLIFNAIMKDVINLIKDRFGNYVFQKVFERGTEKQKKMLIDQLWGKIYELSMHAYGCRVIQKQIECISGNKKEEEIFMDQVFVAPLELIQNQNGNHVIQKCLQIFDHSLIEPIADILLEKFETLAFHSFGCRVIQKYIQNHRIQPKCQAILQKLLLLALPLSQCQYGNYVMQHIVTKCLEQRKALFKSFITNIVQLSTNKYASNVVEKVIQSEGNQFCEQLADEFLNANEQKFILLAKHQFGNYVIQSMMNKTSSNKKTLLRNILKSNAPEISKSQYGRHVLLQLERPHLR